MASDGWRFLGSSAAVREILGSVERVLPRLGPARRVPPILLQGETGTGKGLLARTIHERSPRARGPLVDLNCAAIPATLLESELFGHERGAFTDAREARRGLIEAADGGTLFLDEIALLPDELQAKLLTVLESREVRPLGATRTRPVDVLIIAATNSDLQAAVRERRFREDLYHRLAVLVFSLPPLRNRADDVLELAEAFLARACADHGVPPKRLGDDARAAVTGYRWPGNVRELANAMDRVAMFTEGSVVAAADLDLPAASAEPASLKVSVDGFTRSRLEEALAEAGGNVSAAADKLGVARSTLRYQLERLGLMPGRDGRAVRRSRSLADRLLDRADPAPGTADARRLALPDHPSIAMLPFANLSGDLEQQYFADGMVDDILVGLSRVRWLFVIARQSSFIYKTRSADVQQIGRELGVRYVVEGSVRKASTRVRIVAQLIEAETGAHIWGDRYDGDLRDIFALQDAITERIVSGVEISVRDAEIRRARAKPTESLSAYDLYLRALPAWFGQTQVDYTRTQVLLGQALDVDPGYGEALGSLTDTVATRTIQGWHESWKRGVDETCQLADRALVAGPDSSTCVAAAAFAFGVLADRFDEGLELANRAVMLHPNSVFVRYRAAAVYAVCGENDTAIVQCEAACRMNPLDEKKAATVTFTTLATALYFAGRFEESVHAGKRALTFAPQANTARKYVAVSLAQLGRLDEARAEIAALITHQPSASLAYFRRRGFRHKWMDELHLDGLHKAGLRADAPSP
jgi:transcriptional regulator with AAA-type ATPase domain/TolB-like protein/tetratricopeptide (TPR) repeat protein